MSEPLLDEMLRRARHLVETRGKRVDRGHHDWFLGYQAGRLHLSIREIDDKVLISLKNRGGALSGFWGVYYPELEFPEHSVYKPEHYEEVTEIMRGMMVLDDLANV